MEREEFIGEYNRLLRTKEDLKMRVSQLRSPGQERPKTKYNILTQLVRDNIPKKLFRYRRCTSNDFHALLNDNIYFSNPKNFNDPHDSLLYFNKKELLDEIGHIMKIPCIVKIDESNCLTFNINPVRTKSNPDFKELLNNFVYYLQDKFKIKEKEDEKVLTEVFNRGNSDCDIHDMFKKYVIKQVIEKEMPTSQNEQKVACLTEDIHSTLMWAHYADYHTGFALEYDFKDYSGCEKCPRKDDQSLGMCKNRGKYSLLPIVYDDTRFNATPIAKKMLSRYFDPIPSKKDDEDWSTPSDIDVRKKTLLFKSKYWEYEKEWRLILKDYYKEADMTCMVPTAIYYGAKIRKQDKEILSYIIKSKEGLNIKEYQMDIDYHKEEYGLISIPLQ